MLNVIAIVPIYQDVRLGNVLSSSSERTAAKTLRVHEERIC
jgi:hypothetical protein